MVDALPVLLRRTSRKGGTWRTWTSLVCGGALLLACSGKSGTAPPVERAPSPFPEENLGEYVKLLDEPERPRVWLVRRSGDPQGAVAAALFPPGGTAHVLALAALLEIRLAEQGFPEVRLTSHGLGLVLVQTIQEPTEAPRFFQAVHKSLTEPVRKESAVLTRTEDFLSVVRGRGQQASFWSQCLGDLGAEGKDALPTNLTHAELEELRQQTATEHRLGFAALGEQELLDVVAQMKHQSWPSQTPMEDPWEPGDSFQVLTSSLGRELALGLWSSETEKLLATAQALRERSHPLHARLHALGGGFSLGAVRVTMRPSGACLGVQVLQKAGARAPSAEHWAHLALITRDELEQTLELVRPEEETTHALLAPESAVEGAALAAWTAVRALAPVSGVRRIVEVRVPSNDAGRPDATKLQKLVGETESVWEKRRLDFVSKNEVGQGQAWLLVASPCGSQAEPAEEAGWRSLTVRTLAAQFDGLAGVRLSPWVDSSGVGLLAHSPRLRNETAEQQGVRMARVVARAFAGEQLDGRIVAQTRSELTARLGDNPGEQLALSVLSAGQLALLEPDGVSTSVSTAATTDLERVRAELVEEPLRVAFLANSGEAQARAAEQALAHWLAPLRATPSVCTEPKISPTPAGTWTIETVEPEIRPATFLATHRAGPREWGQAFAHLLDRPGGALDQALAQPGLVASVSARWLGGPHGGGILLSLHAEPEQLEAAEHQARALLDRFAQGALTAEEFERVQERQRAFLREKEETPRGRVVQLWQNREPVLLEEAAFRQFLQGFAADQHLIVRLKNRK